MSQVERIKFWKTHWKLLEKIGEVAWTRQKPTNALGSTSVEL